LLINAISPAQAIKIHQSRCYRDSLAPARDRSSAPAFLAAAAYRLVTDSCVFLLHFPSSNDVSFLKLQFLTFRLPAIAQLPAYLLHTTTMRLFLLSVMPLAFAAKQTVQVGSQGLQFLPDTIYAQIGDTIEFDWATPQHSVTEGTYQSPCKPKTGGIYSGFLDPTKTFTITLNNTEPVWVYCSVSGHCQSGMVMVINPPSTSQSLDGYRAGAANVQAAAQPSALAGGVVASVGAASSSSTSAAASSGTATASSTSSTPTSGAGKDILASRMSVIGAFAGMVAWLL